VISCIVHLTNVIIIIIIIIIIINYSVCKRVNCSSQADSAGVKRLLTWHILALNKAVKHQNVQQQYDDTDYRLTPNVESDRETCTALSNGTNEINSKTNERYTGTQRCLPEQQIGPSSNRIFALTSVTSVSFSGHFALLLSNLPPGRFRIK